MSGIRVLSKFPPTLSTKQYNVAEIPPKYVYILVNEISGCKSGGNVTFTNMRPAQLSTV